MGKASTNKKVARAASTGGGRTHRRVPWTYYSIIVVIAILGVLLTWSSRDHRLSAINAAGTTSQPAVGTVWHEGYAVYECGKFVPFISSTKSPEGIHTASPGDGIITVAPTVKSAAGKNAKLGKFASAVGMNLNSVQLQTPGGKAYLDGDSCEGKAGHVYVKQFSSVGDKIGQLYNGGKNQLPKLDPRDIPFIDQDLLTIAFVPASDAASIPPPPASVGTALNKLTATTASSTTTLPGSTTVPGTTPATTAPASSSTTAPATTVPASTTATTVKK